MVMIGSCEACREDYRIDPRVPEQCVCPTCGRPFRLMRLEEARQTSPEIRAHPRSAVSEPVNRS
jgi:hypothetical protein